MEKHPLHLKQSDLQTSPEVEQAVERKRRRGEKVLNDPSARIETYVDRLEKIFLNPDEKVRKRNLEFFKDKIYDALIIKKENFPESYFELQKRVAREQGRDNVEITSEMRERMIYTAIEEQKTSLENWMDYLTSDDAVYPPWFKYYSWTQIIKLSQFDKERGEFKKRTNSTVAPFPEIYREPLAKIADIYEKVKEDNKALKDPEIKELFSKRFPSLYAEFIQKSLSFQVESREEIEGRWVKYDQGDESATENLFKSLENKGTGWCTAGYQTAETQIGSGDFYVYYTNDKDTNPTQPRLAIRMNGKEEISEVRGVLPHQNVEPILQPILDDKLKEFGSEADSYRKKSADMRRLTEIDKKNEKGEKLTRDDLLFLYEVNSKIEGFGYRRDLRVQEIRSKRNMQEDLFIIFECSPDQIAYHPYEVNEHTKVYIGPLFSGIFQKNIEHIYTSFPKGKIEMDEVEVGGKTAGQLLTELKSNRIHVSSSSEQMMLKPDFTISLKATELTLVRLTVDDLGFSSGGHSDEIFKKAEELGLELCPPDTGPNYLLQYQYQTPHLLSLYIGMKPIIHAGYPLIFKLESQMNGLWLGPWERPNGQWRLGDRFAFRLRRET